MYSLDVSVEEGANWGASTYQVPQGHVGPLLAPRTLGKVSIALQVLQN